MTRAQREWLIAYAQNFYNRNKENGITREDAVVAALEELDDGWGIYIDPTCDEYDDLICEIF